MFAWSTIQSQASVQIGLEQIGLGFQGIGGLDRAW